MKITLMLFSICLRIDVAENIYLIKIDQPYRETKVYLFNKGIFTIDPNQISENHYSLVSSSFIDIDSKDDKIPLFYGYRGIKHQSACSFSIEVLNEIESHSENTQKEEIIYYVFKKDNLTCHIYPPYHPLPYPLNYNYLRADQKHLCQNSCHPKGLKISENLFIKMRYSKEIETNSKNLTFTLNSSDSIYIQYLNAYEIIENNQTNVSKKSYQIENFNRNQINGAYKQKIETEFSLISRNKLDQCKLNILEFTSIQQKINPSILRKLLDEKIQFYDTFKMKKEGQKENPILYSISFGFDLKQGGKSSNPSIRHEYIKQSMNNTFDNRAEFSSSLEVNEEYKNKYDIKYSIYQEFNYKFSEENSMKDHEIKMILPQLFLQCPGDDNHSPYDFEFEQLNLGRHLEYINQFNITYISLPEGDKNDLLIITLMTFGITFIFAIQIFRYLLMY